MSLVTGGMSYAVDQVSNNDSDSDSTSMQDEMIAALAAQLGQTTLQLLQKNLNIKPTLEIRPGYQFNIIVTKDVIFRTAYAPR
jgi:type IV secretion system protein VirB10